MPVHPLVDFGPTLCNLAVTAGDDVSLQWLANVDLSTYAPMASIVNRQTRALVQAFAVVQGGDWDGEQSSMVLELTAVQSLALVNRALDWHMSWTDPATSDERTVIAGSFTARPQ